MPHITLRTLALFTALGAATGSLAQADALDQDTTLKDFGDANNALRMKEKAKADKFAAAELVAMRAKQFLSAFENYSSDLTLRKLELSDALKTFHKFYTRAK